MGENESVHETQKYIQSKGGAGVVAQTPWSVKVTRKEN